MHEADQNISRVYYFEHDAIIQLEIILICKKKIKENVEMFILQMKQDRGVFKTMSNTLTNIHD